MIMTAKRLDHTLLHAPLRLDGHVHHVNGNLSEAGSGVRISADTLGWHSNSDWDYKLAMVC